MDYTKGPWSEITVSQGAEIDISNYELSSITPIKNDDWLLIKAVPDMYEALKLWLGSSVTTPENYEQAIKLGRQALSKAEGR